MAEQPQVAREQLAIPGLESVLGMDLPPKLKFEQPGVVHTITVSGARPVRDTDYKTKEPLFWPSGDPKMVLVLLGEDEDGQYRCHWVNGARANDAMRKALAAAGVHGVAVGDVWTITRGQDEEIPPARKGAEPTWANTWDYNVVPAGVA